MSNQRMSWKEAEAVVVAHRERQAGFMRCQDSVPTRPRFIDASGKLSALIAFGLVALGGAFYLSQDSARSSSLPAYAEVNPELMVYPVEESPAGVVTRIEIHREGNQVEFRSTENTM